MYIKSIVIDGFKSYAQRTEVNGFDPLFNAITGLNGSGKSNILDSICFVLGISNLTQVRAANLQDLVYKSGQAGITKAAVSITFDNSDKNQSPLGYEQYEEITVTRVVVVGGRNKYMVNGTTANNTRVQDLFRSVQLNVNNPHFLIMQGRITKVLNMKPLEILSMIEEAAGTRLYESKKEAAEKIIEKKDAKLKEIDTILNEEITPTLQKLKDERASYLEHQKVVRELEHLSKLCVAYQFTCAEETKKTASEELVRLREASKGHKGRLKEIDVNVAELATVISELEQKRLEEQGDSLSKLEADVSDKQKVEAKASSSLEHKLDAIKGEKKKQKDNEKSQAEDASAHAQKKKDVDRLSKAVTKATTEWEAANEAQEAAQRHFHAVSAGLSASSDGGEAATLSEQLLSAKNEISGAETEAKQADMKMRHCKQEIAKKQGELKRTEKEYAKDSSALEAIKTTLQTLEGDLKQIGYVSGSEEELLDKKKSVAVEVEKLQSRVDALEDSFPQLQFDYKDPEKNFDRSKVYGPIAKLIKVKDVSTATALEVTAGGKLYNIVVDTEVTGKKLLDKGELKRRYTIIPLNKISASAISEDVVRRARSLVGSDNVHTALSLVGFKDDLEGAMKYVFGSSFVCKDMDIAKKVTFDEKVMKKSVTLEGDSFDPAGTLTGGARSQGAAILSRLSDIVDMTHELQQKKRQLFDLDAKLNDVKAVAAHHRQLAQQLELKRREAELVEARVKQTTHHLQLDDIGRLELALSEQEAVIARTAETRARASTKVSELEDKLKNAKGLRERELKEAEVALSEARRRADSAGETMRARQQEAEGARLEAESLERDVTACGDLLRASAAALADLEAVAERLRDDVTAARSAVAEAQAALKRRRDELGVQQKEIAARQAELKALRREGDAAQLALQELEHTVGKREADSKNAAKQVEQLLQKYDWIADECKYFGQADTAYDFVTNDPKEAGRRRTKLEEMRDKLAKSVNMRAMNMLSKAEEQYADLTRKRRIVLNDKSKIAAVITELDEKKNEALRKAHEQVNKDFGSIFATLLPGARAKLAPTDGAASVLDGLEFRIAFGEVWKESLTELSGGQRSLVALSLILALLLFKPAPLYILDEVDAALDLSHTQNIGQMLRTHFRHSQFIVVSLKDGMFNNANVLFKTKFVDGVSTVARFVTNKPTSAAVRDKENVGEASARRDKNKKVQRQEASNPLTERSFMDDA